MSRRDSDSFGNLVCSFCGKSQREVKKLIAGPTVHICDECIELCNDIIAEEAEQDLWAGTTKMPKPAEIKTVLDRLCDRAGQGQKNPVRRGSQSL